MRASGRDLPATAEARVRAAENAWNARDLEGLVLSNAAGCLWRCRAEFLWGREQVRDYLARRWRRELDYRVVNELWAVDGQCLALRFACEYRDDSGTWFRAFGNEMWECDETGLVHRRLSSVNEHPIREHERVLRWPLGARPPGQPSLAELAL